MFPANGAYGINSSTDRDESGNEIFGSGTRETFTVPRPLIQSCPAQSTPLSRTGNRIPDVPDNNMEIGADVFDNFHKRKCDDADVSNRPSFI